MKDRITLEISPQPDDVTCGPTCLHAVYRYYGDPKSLAEVIAETPQLEEGGTLAALLGRHALDRGYQAKVYTCDVEMFDPTWFAPGAATLVERLRAQMRVKKSPNLHSASLAFISFLEAGGELLMEDLTAGLLRKHLSRGAPILAGLSSTFLYRHVREYGPNCIDDDLRGTPAGHFVVLCGLDETRRNVLVADPYSANPLSDDHFYTVAFDRLVCAILLGVLTYDANLLIIEPRKARRKGLHERGDTDDAGTEA